MTDGRIVRQLKFSKPDDFWKNIYDFTTWKCSFHCLLIFLFLKNVKLTFIVESKEFFFTVAF